MAWRGYSPVILWITFLIKSTFFQASSQTTPNTANSGSYFAVPPANKHYLFLEINKTRAELVKGQQYCLGFAYTLSGKNAGERVRIYLEDENGSSRVVWMTTTPTSWTKANYTFTFSALPSIELYGSSVNKNGYDAADDVTLTPGKC